MQFVILVFHKTSFWYFGLFNDISDNMLFWKCPKLSRWIFLSVHPYACCQNSASHSYKIILFRAIFLILNYPELLNEVSVLLKTCKNVQTEWWNLHQVQKSPLTQKINTVPLKLPIFDILAFSMIYQEIVFRKNHKVSVTRW